jgi:hypothetical protein
MELRDFIKQSRVDLLGGIRDAQEDEKLGAFVVPSGTGNFGSFAEDRGIKHTGRMLTGVVQFDIAVTVETSKIKTGKGGLAIKILEAGMSRERSARNTEASRIQFSVPLILPQSSRAWSEEPSTKN